MLFDRKPLPDVVIEVFPFEPVAPKTKSSKQRGRPRLPEPAVDDTRLQAVETWLASESLKPNTRRSYARELKRFLVWSDRALESLTQADIALYKDDLKVVKAEAGETNNSVNVALTALRSFFNWYCAQPSPAGQPARVNPTLRVKFERVPLPLPQDVSQTALEWLDMALEYTGETQQRDRALVQVLRHGLRAGELVSLNVGSYDGRRVQVERTKTNEPRTVPLCEAGRTALNEYLEGRATDGETLTPERPLIHSLSSRSERLSYHGVYQVMKRLGVLAAQLSLEDWLSRQSKDLKSVREGVSALNADSLVALAPMLPSGIWAVASELVQLHPHQLRHTYATGLFRQRLNPTHARRLLGHSSEQTTRRYTQAVEAEAAEQAYYQLIGEAE